MTYNQVIKRIQTIVLAHKQVRNFYLGLKQDQLTDKTTRYPSVFLENNGGNISLSGQAATFSFTISFLDLVHVSEDSKQNEQDVHSDMVSVAQDILAQLNYGGFNDWSLTNGSNLALFVREFDNDMLAGCIIDFSIEIPYFQNVCEIPTDAFFSGSDTPGNSGSIDMKVYDLEYISIGIEGGTLTIPTLQGKKILLVLRENSINYKVSNAPDTTEYTWDGINLGFGLLITSVQRFIFLYRNY